MDKYKPIAIRINLGYTHEQMVDALNEAGTKNGSELNLNVSKLKDREKGIVKWTVEEAVALMDISGIDNIRRIDFH